MKETGIVRKIDNVGRIVIPKELRWKYQIDCGDMVEIFVEDDSICMKKYDTGNNIMNQVEALYKTVEQMEQEVKDTTELKGYLAEVKEKLEQFQS